MRNLKTIKTVLFMTIIFLTATSMNGQDKKCCSGKEKQSQKLNDQSKMNNEKHADMAMNTYACPMHPEITGVKDDKCTKCGMFLKEMEQTSNVNVTKKSKELAATYACPMHPEITGVKGDKCSKCGMFLSDTKREEE